MYCCIYASGNLPILLDCARQFSPLIEMHSDMVVFDARGRDCFRTTNTLERYAVFRSQTIVGQRGSSASRFLDVGNLGQCATAVPGPMALPATGNLQLTYSPVSPWIRIPPSPPGNKRLSHFGLNRIGSGFYAP